MSIEELLRKEEGKTLEFKKELSGSDAVVRTVVAFANTSGGTLVIGVEDKTKKVKGVLDPLQAEERLVNMVVDNIHPHLSPDIEILPWRKTQVMAVHVYPSSAKPHYFKRLGFQKGVFVRIGSSNRVADRCMTEEMKRQSLNQFYDEQPFPELNSEAIDFRAASELFRSKKTLKKSDFETLQIVVRHQNREVPTVGGMLLFGKERGRYFPDAWIHAGLFGGKDRTQILDSARITGPLPSAVEEAILFVTRHLSHSLTVGNVKHRRVLALPPIAVREAIVNAVVHADYSQRGSPIRISLFKDRLEIENPGLLPSGLTLDDIQHGVSKIRNRVLARVFNELGYIEQWGSGIQRMFGACVEAGLKRPLLEEIGPHFRATLFTGKERNPTLDPVDRKIIDLLGARALSTQEIADRIERSVRAARTRLLSLIQRGLVIEIGSGPNDPQKKYHLPNEA